MEEVDKNNWLFSGNSDGNVFQCVSVCAFEKLTCNEFIPYPKANMNLFDDNDDDLWADFRLFQEGLNEFLKEKNILVKNEKIRLGMNNKSIKNKNSLLWQGTSEKTAGMLFDALTEYSIKSDTGFIVNYYCARESEFNNHEKKTIITFHPEVIMNGKRLVNDDTNSETVTLKEAQNKVCNFMLSSLNHYFSEGLTQDVKNKIVSIFEK